MPLPLYFRHGNAGLPNRGRMLREGDAGRPSIENASAGTPWHSLSIRGHASFARTSSSGCRAAGCLSRKPHIAWVSRLAFFVR